MASLRAGSTFAKLIKEQRTAITAIGSAGEALTCLAVADGSSEVCESVPSTSKGYCELTTNLARVLKPVPKKDLTAHVLHFYCLGSGTSKEECDQGLAIMIAGDPAACRNLKDETRRQICTGLMKGDPKVCDRLSKPDDRVGCSMMIGADASRCPKDSKPCQALARMMKALKSGGLEDLQDIEPALAAAKNGRPACASLLKSLESACKAPGGGATASK